MWAENFLNLLTGGGFAGPGGGFFSLSSSSGLPPLLLSVKPPPGPPKPPPHPTSKIMTLPRLFRCSEYIGPYIGSLTFFPLNVEFHFLFFLSCFGPRRV